MNVTFFCSIRSFRFWVNLGVRKLRLNRVVWKFGFSLNSSNYISENVWRSKSPQSPLQSSLIPTLERSIAQLWLKIEKFFLLIIISNYLQVNPQAPINVILYTADSASFAKSNTMATHNNHIFVRPRKMCLF